MLTQRSTVWRLKLPLYPQDVSDRAEPNFHPANRMSGLPDPSWSVSLPAPLRADHGGVCSKNGATTLVFELLPHASASLGSDLRSCLIITHVRRNPQSASAPGGRLILGHFPESGLRAQLGLPNGICCSTAGNAVNLLCQEQTLWSLPKSNPCKTHAPTTEVNLQSLIKLIELWLTTHQACSRN